MTRPLNIVLNGDSNMCGEELEDRSLGLGTQIVQLLGGKEINLSLSGASNDRIYDTTKSYVDSGAPVDLIVIGWSEMSRVQWWFEEDGRAQFWEVNNLGVGRMSYPQEFDQRLQHWHASADNLEYRTGLSHYWHERIYNLHRYLEYRLIPHVFFHAFHDFKIHQAEYQLDWNNRFMDPYSWDNTYTHWAAAQGYSEITPGWYHYEPAAQRAWAERVVAHVRKYNIL